jgi:hypothetical protein
MSELYTLIIKLGGEQYISKKADIDHYWAILHSLILTDMGKYNKSFNDVLTGVKIDLFELVFRIDTNYFLKICRSDWQKKESGL